MKRILALTTVNNTLALKEAVREVTGKLGPVFSLEKVYLDDFEDPDVSLGPVEEKIARADIVLVDIRGDVRVARELHSMVAGHAGTVVVLVAGNQDLFALTRMGRFHGSVIFRPGQDREFDVNTYLKTKKFAAMTKKLGALVPVGMLKGMRDWVLCQEYYAEGDAENLKNLLLVLLRRYGGIKTGPVPKPACQPPFGLYCADDGKIYGDRNGYDRASGFDRSLQTVAVLMYGGMHFYDTRPVAEALQTRLKGQCNLRFIFSRAEHNIEALERYGDGIDLLINLQYFRIHGGPYGGSPEPTYELLQKRNVPLFTGLRSYDTDIEDWRESGAGLNPLEKILGVVLPELDGAIEPLFLAGLSAREDPLIGTMKWIEAIPDRVEKLCRRVLKWLDLRKLPNREKRLALVVYNYPPGEHNLAGAGYLDTFKSLERFMERLRESGYEIQVPEGGVKDLLLSEGFLNSPGYGVAGGVSVHVGEYLEWFRELPPAVQDEVVSRWGDPPGEIMTDTDRIVLPLVRLGNLVLGVQPSRGDHEGDYDSYHDRDLPPHHQYLAFYFYLEKNFQAHALVHFGMHGTLEFTKGKEVALSSGCYPDILIGSMPHLYYYWIGNTSEATIAKRRSCALCLSHASPPVTRAGLYERYADLDELLRQYREEGCGALREEIASLAEDLHLPADFALLAREVERMKLRLIPAGLHVMDRNFSDDELVQYLLPVLNREGDYPPLQALLKKLEGVHVSETAAHGSGAEKELIWEILEGRERAGLPEGYGEYLRSLKKRIDFSLESDGLIRALNGAFIEPARGGDPVRDPEVYPSGRSLYAFDPRLIPTPAASVRGQRAAESLLASYFEKHGEYPETVALVLWGFETMKTGGDTVAAILSLMGLRISHRKNLWFKELEAVPPEELKRPRIDVLVTICGIFRDTFTNLIDLLNRAFEMAAGLDEDPAVNFVRKHVSGERGELGEAALARIFGPSPSEYATAMTNLIETGSWNDEGELSKSYEESMNYAYYRGKVMRRGDAFSRMLGRVDMVSQERDGVEYEVTELDHYYEFLGGLSKSVERKRGRQAELMVVDTTEDDILVEDLKSSLERATRTRLLNPRWLDGMLNHDYHGAQKIQQRVDYMLGFSATTGTVDDWVYDRIADTLVLDPEMLQRIRENNPYAAVKIGERLMEIEKRGYWKTDTARLREIRNSILTGEEGIE